VSEYQQRHVMLVLQAFNDTHRQQINTAYAVQLAPITDADFWRLWAKGSPRCSISLK